jgi:hypothetical protein
MRWRTYALVALLAGLAVGAASLIVLRANCVNAGGAFDWSRAGCEMDRPVILQGDIHRV